MKRETPLISRTFRIPLFKPMFSARGVSVVTAYFLRFRGRGRFQGLLRLLARHPLPRSLRAPLLYRSPMRRESRTGLCRKFPETVLASKRNTTRRVARGLQAGRKVVKQRWIRGSSLIAVAFGSSDALLYLPPVDTACRNVDTCRRWSNWCNRYLGGHRGESNRLHRNMAYSLVVSVAYQWFQA